MHKILIPVPVADNLSNTDTFYNLPDYGVVSLLGPEAVAFAQAQFCNDLSALAPGEWQWNALLTAKGRVIALFALLHVAEGEILLLIPDYPAEQLAAQLSRLVFRRKVKVSIPGDLHLSASLAAPTQAKGKQLGESTDALEIDFGTPEQPRALRVGALRSPEDPALTARWRSIDLSHGLPRLPESQREQWTPQQLSLQRLPAFSVKKGCYPGQEIVARTHFLGKAKRGLQYFSAPSLLPDGTPILVGERSVGEVCCVAPSATGCTLLAVISLEHIEDQMIADSQALTRLPLLDGLQR